MSISLETVDWVCVCRPGWHIRKKDSIKRIRLYLMSFKTAENCSGEVALGDVDTNRTKYSCWSKRPGRFELTIYKLMCLLYCFDRFPETSSHHKGSMTTYSSSSLARARRGLGILGTFMLARKTC